MEGSTLCDPTRLTPAEATAVQAARYRRNLEKCNTGSPTCEPLLLNAKDAATFHKIAQERNYAKCLDGSPTCDPTRLTPPEGKSVQSAALAAIWTGESRIVQLRSYAADTQ